MSEDNVQNQDADHQDEPKNEPKMVPESDLLAVKRSLSKDLKDAQKAFEEEKNNLISQLTETQQNLLKAEAKVESLEEKQSQSVDSNELTEAKSQLEAAQQSSKELAQQVLEYRRKLLSQSYGVAEDALAEKNLDQLGALEEALELTKTISNGNYATGTGGGGSDGPETPMERAKRILDEADKRPRRSPKD